MKNRVAFLGGSFDPPHIGHLNLFHQAALLGYFKTLYLIPAYRSNFKRKNKMASKTDRLNMLALLIKDYKNKYKEDKLNIEILTYEVDKEGISYSSDTVRYLLPEFSDDNKINWIIGDDIVKDLDKWHEAPFIKENVRFFCFSRLNEEEINTNTINSDFDITYIDSEVTTASSSEIRSGNTKLLSESVWKYINENGLYRSI